MYVFDQFYFTQCLASFSFIDHLLCSYARFLILFHLTWMRFSQSTHLSISLSFQTLTSIVRTGSPFLVKLIDLVNSVIIFPSQMTLLSWLTFLLTHFPDCDSHSHALLDLFLSSDAGICFIMAFPALGNSDCVVVSVSIDFPINSEWDAPFHSIAYDYSFADWDDLHDHLRDVPSENIFKLSASAAASEFCERVHIEIDVYIPHCKYQVKPHSLSISMLIGMVFVII